MPPVSPWLPAGRRRRRNDPIQPPAKYVLRRDVFLGKDADGKRQLHFHERKRRLRLVQNKYVIGYGPNDIRELGDSKAYKSTTNDYYSVLELFATFNKAFDKHYVTGILGFNQEYNRWNWYKAEREGIISTSLPSIGLSSGDQFVSEQYADSAIRGLFFRANYTYDNRYIFEVNGRYDGTSCFPKEKRFGFFPSASAAWRVDAEPFFESFLSTVSQLKVRFIRFAG